MRRWGRRGWRSRGVRRRSGGKSGKAGKLLTRRRVVFLLVLLFLLFFFQTFIFIERNLQKPLMTVAEVRVKQVATQAINKSITEQVADQTDADKLIEWKTNAAGKISGFMLNYAEHMRITSETIDTVQDTLDRMGDIPEKIPLGQALGSAIIASFGPRIPVKFEPIGAVKVDLNTRQKDAGINMILVEVYMHIVAEVSIIIPFDTKPELVETEIPISYLLVVGDVPTYYYDGKGNPVGETAPNAPSIAIPAEPGKSDADVIAGGDESAPNESDPPADAESPADTP
ncbi:sporulation protein YunB [Paenibacillus glycinis]|uniref:Sporulation protein YunB n=1 Tax=Paenibacillus glycinis TaxID=2697035 RepID=A0ABW9XYH1_9BACL|nr:sporulation protein YunB [Paenibacillus glycinis]NBD27679.1 sporulation protein YunB [Paenibacillus glycinis]